MVSGHPQVIRQCYPPFFLSSFKPESLLCALMTYQKVLSMTCTFRKFSGVPCGLSSTSAFTEVINIKSCNRDVEKHLTRVKVSTRCVGSEWELILARCGIFQYEGVEQFTICPRHRDGFGIFWKPSTKCQHPLHGVSKRRPDRGIGRQMSEEINQIWNVLCTIGAGMF